MINWMYFPKSDQAPGHLRQVVDVFSKNNHLIDSVMFQLPSNDVLWSLRQDLEGIGYVVESDKTAAWKIKVPVLFGVNGKMDKYFDADWYNASTQTVIEVEAWRAVVNYQFLKDLFQACVMHDVDYLVIAVRNTYRDSEDFSKVVSFFETMYASSRLKLPLKGILIVGY